MTRSLSVVCTDTPGVTPFVYSVAVGIVIGFVFNVIFVVFLLARWCWTTNALLGRPRHHHRQASGSAAGRIAWLEDTDGDEPLPARDTHASGGGTFEKLSSVGDGITASARPIFPKHLAVSYQAGSPTLKADAHAAAGDATPNHVAARRRAHRAEVRRQVVISCLCSLFTIALVVALIGVLLLTNYISFHEAGAVVGACAAVQDEAQCTAIWQDNVNTCVWCAATQTCLVGNCLTHDIAPCPSLVGDVSSDAGSNNGTSAIATQHPWLQDCRLNPQWVRGGLALATILTITTSLILAVITVQCCRGDAAARPLVKGMSCRDKWLYAGWNLSDFIRAFFVAVGMLWFLIISTALAFETFEFDLEPLFPETDIGSGFILGLVLISSFKRIFDHRKSTFGEERSCRLSWPLVADVVLLAGEIGILALLMAILLTSHHDVLFASCVMLLVLIIEATVSIEHLYSDRLQFALYLLIAAEVIGVIALAAECEALAETARLYLELSVLLQEWCSMLISDDNPRHDTCFSRCRGDKADRLQSTPLLETGALRPMNVAEQDDAPVA